MTDYKEKYLKYKNKYLTVQAQLEGGNCKIDLKNLDKKKKKKFENQIKIYL